MTQVELCVYTATHLICGYMTLRGSGRLSDHVNSQGTSYLDLVQSTVCELLVEGAPAVAAAAITIRKDAIELIAPRDTLVPGRPARVRTERIPVEVTTGLFTVRGAVHRRKNDPPQLLQLLTGTGRTFVPLTAATVRYLPNAAFDSVESTVLLNTRGWATARALAQGPTVRAEPEALGASPSPLLQPVGA
jgi:hypothetical protein